MTTLQFAFEIEGLTLFWPIDGAPQGQIEGLTPFFSPYRGLAYRKPQFRVFQQISKQCQPRNSISNRRENEPKQCQPFKSQMRIEGLSLFGAMGG